MLRVLGSARKTNDLDYVFVPYKSNNEIEKELVECVESVEDVHCKYALNSKCLRIDVTAGDAHVMVEASCSKELRVQKATTALLSPQYDLPKRIINVMDYSVSLSNKLAAWNERRLIRDVYDIWFFLQMGVRPDTRVLENRLKKPSYSKRLKNNEQFTGKTASGFYEHFRKYIVSLDDHIVAEEMKDYLDNEDRTGLSMMFKSAVALLR